MSRKEAQHLLTRAPQCLHRRLPGAGKIVHGFVDWIKDLRTEQPYSKATGSSPR